MSTIRDLVKRHPVVSYYVVVFTISWGGILLLAAPGGIPGTPADVERLFFPVLIVMFAGPFLGGLLLTALVTGREGFRGYVARLIRWRVEGQWVAIALLTGPVLVAIVLFGLSLFHGKFLPGIFQAEDKLGLIAFGLGWGLVGGGFLEETGWTGFAIPQLRKRYSAFRTGLIVGLLWGLWHMLIAVWASRGMAGETPMADFVGGFVSFYLVALPAYRILMVWVYDRTDSLLVAMLMHAVLSASTLIFQPQTASGHTTWNLLLGIALWVIVLAVAVARRGQVAPDPVPGAAG